MGTADHTGIALLPLFVLLLFLRGGYRLAVKFGAASISALWFKGTVAAS